MNKRFIKISNLNENILGAFGDSIIERLSKALATEKLVAVTDVNGIPVEDSEFIEVADDHSHKFDDIDTVKEVSLYESKGFLIKINENHPFMLITDSAVKEKVNLYEMNSRIIDFYNENQALISCLNYNIIINKLSNSSTKAIYESLNTLVTRMNRYKNYETCKHWSNVFNEINSNTANSYSLMYHIEHNIELSRNKKNYLIELIKNIRNNPRNFGLFNEEDYKNL